jgi:hypothetical protein
MPSTIGPEFQPSTGGSGTFNALTGDASSTATGGATTVLGIQGVAQTAGTATILSQLNGARTRTLAAALSPGEETVYTGAGGVTATLPGNTTQNSTVNTITNATAGIITLAPGAGTTLTNGVTAGNISIASGVSYQVVYIAASTAWYVSAAANEGGTGGSTFASVTITGLTGATSGALRFVGNTNTGGPPTSGTFIPGDVILDNTATWWVCVVGGTPGTWTVTSDTDAVVRSATATAVLGETTIFQGATPAQTITLAANPVRGTPAAIVNQASVSVTIAGGTNSINNNGSTVASIVVPPGGTYGFTWVGGVWMVWITNISFGDVTGPLTATVVGAIQGVAITPGQASEIPAAVTYYSSLTFQ